MEQWQQYLSDKIKNDDYEVYEISRNEFGTSIKLVGLINELHLHFDFVDSLRFTDEGRRLATYNDVEQLQIYRKTFKGNPIFLVKNSNYIDWLNTESAGFIGAVDHFVIVTRNDIIDIISNESPRIECFLLKEEIDGSKQNY